MPFLIHDEQLSPLLPFSVVSDSLMNFQEIASEEFGQSHVTAVDDFALRNRGPSEYGKRRELPGFPRSQRSSVSRLTRVYFIGRAKMFLRKKQILLMQIN